MKLFGIRGATTVPANSGEDILRETEALLRALIHANELSKENVVSIIFTSTQDLTAEFPAKACHRLGWTDVPRLGAVEADVPGGMPRCIRILVHAYREEHHKVCDIYLKDARKLRPDLVQ